ncbi:hypothetical protein [Streptomyces sp. NPDC059994]|uniref:DUF7352 domain-containing protein n=1 Tax=Streptomyces sp. NPDC059994 TaxID=3347029 RepID=UPI0036B34E56
MSSAIYRYEIPVDDQWHAVQLSGDVIHVACRNPRAVELWGIHTDGPSATRGFRVFGTGQPLPGKVRHVGTAPTPDGQLVWHLLELA